MNETYKIACLGEAMIEITPTGAQNATIGVAGDTYNTAVYLRRELADDKFQVSYVTAVGDEAMSQRIVAALNAEGIDTQHIERREGQMPGLYMISVDETGERSFSYWRSMAAARTLFSAPCTVTMDSLSDYDLVYPSGISLAILPQETRDAFYDWIDGFRARGGKVAYDSNYRQRLWENPETARTETMKMWARCDIALPSVDDEMELFEEQDESEVVQRLQNAGVTFGALKRGAKGPLALDGSDTALKVAPAKNVIDTTAAGDSFNAGFLAAYAKGQDITAAMQAGHNLSSVVIQNRGAILPRH